MTSIKSKIVLFTVVMMILLPVVFALYFIREHTAMDKQIAENVEETFQILNATWVRDLRNAMLANQISGIRDSFLSMRAFKQIRSATLLDGYGKVAMKDDGVFVPRGQRVKSTELKENVLRKILASSEIQQEVRKENAFLLYRYLVPFKNEEECQKCHGQLKKTNGVLVLHFQVPDVLQETHRFTVLTFSLYLLGIALTSVFLLFLLNKIVVLPLHEMQRAMQEVSDGNLSVQILSRREDEIGAVSRYFNDMVNKLKRAQSELEKSIREKEQEHALAEVGMMASRVAHEVRNPLNVLDGVALYLKTSDEENKKDVHELAGLIENSIKRLERFSKDLLSYGKSSELKKEPLDVHSFLRDKVRGFLQFNDTKNIRVALRLPEEELCVLMDPFRMGEVFENLLQNAYEASPGGGEIEVCVKEGGSYVDIIVRDKGCGISKENRKNLFKPFVSTKPSGTGLGLCIVKRIVESHGGTFIVESVEGEGTEAVVRLPRKDDNVQANENSHSG